MALMAIALTLSLPIVVIGRDEIQLLRSRLVHPPGAGINHKTADENPQPSGKSVLSEEKPALYRVSSQCREYVTITKKTS